MPMRQPQVRKRRYQQKGCHFLQEKAYNWTPLSGRICQLITLILNIVPTRHNEATWTGIITYHWVQRDTQQMFLSHLNLFLLINSSVLSLDEIFALFDYQVIIYRIREAICFTRRLWWLCMAVIHIYLKIFFHNNLTSFEFLKVVYDCYSFLP